MTEETTPCKWCEEPTPMLVTKECNDCWEIRRRAESNPAKAMAIVTTILDAHCEEQEDTLLAYNKVDEILKRIGR